MSGWYVYSSVDHTSGGVWCEAETAEQAVKIMNDAAGVNQEDGYDSAKPMTREEWDSLPDL